MYFGEIAYPRGVRRRIVTRHQSILDLVRLCHDVWINNNNNLLVFPYKDGITWFSCPATIEPKGNLISSARQKHDVWTEPYSRAKRGTGSLDSNTFFLFLWQKFDFTTVSGSRPERIFRTGNHLFIWDKICCYTYNTWAYYVNIWIIFPSIYLFSNLPINQKLRDFWCATDNENLNGSSKTVLDDRQVIGSLWDVGSQNKTSVLLQFEWLTDYAWSGA